MLVGGSHHDLLHGGWGNDELWGESGSDDLIGREGVDSCYLVEHGFDIDLGCELYFD